MWTLVDAGVLKLFGKRVLVNITLPERVLAIDDEAVNSQITLVISDTRPTCGRITARTKAC